MSALSDIQKKRKADRDSYTLKQSLRKQWHSLQSGFSNESNPNDNYSITPMKFQFWTGIIQEELSDNHHELDTVARLSNSRLTLVQRLKSIQSQSKLEILDIL